MAATAVVTIGRSLLTLRSSAAAIGRSLLSFRSSASPFITCKRTFSSSSSIARASHPSGFRRPAVSLSHSLLQVAAVRLNPTGCPAKRSGGLNISYGEIGPLLFDYDHWLIVMEKPGGEGATKQEMIDCYVQTLAKVLGSEEEAKKKIYNVSLEKYYGFGCEIDEETSKKLNGLPGVQFALPDTYVDAENKDYGAELYVNGEIVQRSPERQRRVDAYPHNRL